MRRKECGVWRGHAAGFVLCSLSIFTHFGHFCEARAEIRFKQSYTAFTSTTCCLLLHSAQPLLASSDPPAISIRIDCAFVRAFFKAPRSQSLSVVRVALACFSNTPRRLWLSCPVQLDSPCRPTVVDVRHAQHKMFDTIVHHLPNHHPTQQHHPAPPTLPPLISYTSLLLLPTRNTIHRPMPPIHVRTTVRMTTDVVIDSSVIETPLTSLHLSTLLPPPLTCFPPN